MTKILHIAARPLNGHPAWISELQNRHGWESKVCLIQGKETGKRPYSYDIKPTDRAALKEWTSACNVVHFHGDITLDSTLGAWLRQWFNPKTMVIQHHYHERSLLEYRIRTRKIESFEHEIMAEKKGAILDPGLPLVPVVVPIWRGDMAPNVVRRERLKAIFTPTTTSRALSYRGSKGKGYHETKAVLDKLKYLDVEIINDLNWRETIDRVRNADIRIDELVTGGYGIATLEGLALGCLTISGCNDEVKSFLGDPPIFRAMNNDLAEVIDRICHMPWEERVDIQKAGIEWMKKNRNEHIMFERYKKTYEDCMDKTGFSKDEISKDYSKKVYSVFMSDFREDPEPVVMPSKGGKLIVQIARTNCAGAIWRIHEAINKYTTHTCRTITASDTTNGRKYPSDVLLHDGKSVRNLIERADVVHFHNWIDHESSEMRLYRELLAKKNKVLQYHTEPSILQRNYRRDVINREDIKTLVIGQKHARFYPKSTVIPNLVDIEDPLLSPSNRKWDGGPLKVIYTPSDLKSYPDYSCTCCGKGYQDTTAVLKRLEEEGLIQATIITDMTWEELMPIKRQHDVCIDECVTGGYHLCSLESLSQGLITIAWIDDKTRATLKQMTGNDDLPWVNTRMCELYDRLKSLARSSPENVENIKRAGRRWMEENWNTRKMVEKFIDAYDIEEVEPSVGHVHRSWSNARLLRVYQIEGNLLQDALLLEGKWKDRPVVIWGNGHTVTEALEHRGDKWMEEAAHIGTNAASLLPMKFDAYCIGDMRFVAKPEKAKIAREAPGVRVYQSCLRRLMPPDLPISYAKTIGNDGICSDLRAGVYHGYSVVWFALQVALWSGTKEILLAGCPHDYSAGKPRFYNEAVPSPVDNTLSYILRNYSAAIPILKSMGIRVRTIGKSRLNTAGVDPLLTSGVF
jgi:hypothetical protein